MGVQCNKLLRYIVSISYYDNSDFIMCNGLKHVYELCYMCLYAKLLSLTYSMLEVKASILSASEATIIEKALDFSMQSSFWWIQRE